MKFKFLASLLVFTSFNVFQVSAFALDCTKAPDSQSPSCLSKQKSGNEEINQFSALAQKEAQRSANKSAAAKAPSPTVSAKTPVATVIPIPSGSGNSANLPPQNMQSAAPQLSQKPINSKKSKSSKNSKNKVLKTNQSNSKGKKTKSATAICKKGNKIKKIKGANPTCPPGYVKK
jgi:hypothetical protein